MVRVTTNRNDWLVKFIDLFAGLGGFHVAMTNLGHECVFACDNDMRLSELYTKNFKIDCHGDIRQIPVSAIPEHDILCAGFPCQPFSKAGNQRGLDDVGRGDLIFDIFRVLEYHRPKYFILENVPNLRRHQRERTWDLIEAKLAGAGYDVREAILSPHQFGIPQHRKRIFIVGSRLPHKLDDDVFPQPEHNPSMSVREVLSIPPDPNYLSDRHRECLKSWQKIIDMLPTGAPLPTFPIWSMELGATYPVIGPSPFAMSSRRLSEYHGAFGMSLKGVSKQKQLKALPSYAAYPEDILPAWKVRIILKNREFLESLPRKARRLVLELSRFPKSWQKLEWNAGSASRSIYENVIQFRASGIRVKRPDYIPSLVLTSTQIPVIGWEMRYLSLSEAAELQGLNAIALPSSTALAFRALGNAVNAQLVELVARRLLR